MKTKPRATLPPEPKGHPGETFDPQENYRLLVLGDADQRGILRIAKDDFEDPANGRRVFVGNHSNNAPFKISKTEVRQFTNSGMFALCMQIATPKADLKKARQQFLKMERPKMAKPAKLKLDSKTCSQCNQPLKQTDWNSAVYLLTCDNWHCSLFRRPQGQIPKR